MFVCFSKCNIVWNKVIRFKKKIFITIRKNIPNELLNRFLNQSNALSAIDFHQLSSSNLDMITQGFNTINALISFIEPLSNSSSSEIDLKK